jgi:hypothetical protein
MAAPREQHHERVCSFLVPNDKAPSSANEIREALESNDDDSKVDAMQRAIAALLNGEQLPALFITIVRYVLPCENHLVQKLLLLYLVSPRGATRPCAAASWHHAWCAPGPDGRRRLPAQETIEKTDASGKLLPEMVGPKRRGRGGGTRAARPWRGHPSSGAVARVPGPGWAVRTRSPPGTTPPPPH